MGAVGVAEFCIGLFFAVALIKILAKDNNIGIFVLSTVAVPVTPQNVHKLDTIVFTAGPLIPEPDASVSVALGFLVP